MSIRTTVDIPEPLHEELRRRAQNTGASMRSLIIDALEQTYSKQKKGRPVTGPLIRTKGELGPLFPVDENPHDFIFS